jgi:outer membrane protein insertion porin family
MKTTLWVIGVWMGILLASGSIALAQNAGPQIDRVEIKFIGSATVSNAFILDHIKLKAGDPYTASASQDDVRSLYATGQFYNLRVKTDPAEDGGVVLTYLVQCRMRLAAIRFEGNAKFSDDQLKVKLSLKVGDPADEQKAEADAQSLIKFYQDQGWAGAKVRYVINLDPAAGRGTVTYQITESPKAK